MNNTNSARSRSLTGRELFDLARAGFILLVTVVAALLVPPRAFGAAPEATVFAARATLENLPLDEALHQQRHAETARAD
jgi:hypothetical protein